MRIFTYIFVILVIFLGVTFAILNATPVAFNYYIHTKAISLSLLLVFAFGAGLILGALFISLSWIRLKLENSRLKSRLKNLESAIDEKQRF